MLVSVKRILKEPKFPRAYKLPRNESMGENEKVYKKLINT